MPEGCDEFLLDRSGAYTGQHAFAQQARNQLPQPARRNKDWVATPMAFRPIPESQICVAFGQELRTSPCTGQGFWK